LNFSPFSTNFFTGAKELKPKKPQAMAAKALESLKSADSVEAKDECEESESSEDEAEADEGPEAKDERLAEAEPAGPASPVWALNATTKTSIFSKLYGEITANSQLPEHNSAEFMHALGIMAKADGVDIWTKDSKRGKTPDFGDSNCKWRAWKAFLLAGGNENGLAAKSPKSKKSSKPKKVKASKATSPSPKPKIPAYLEAAFEAYKSENGKDMPKKLKSIAVFVFKSD
jgi:hypothetical protein